MEALKASLCLGAGTPWGRRGVKSFWRRRWTGFKHRWEPANTQLLKVEMFADTSACCSWMVNVQDVHGGENTLNLGWLELWWEEMRVSLLVKWASCCALPSQITQPRSAQLAFTLNFSAFIFQNHFILCWVGGQGVEPLPAVTKWGDGCSPDKFDRKNWSWCSPKLFRGLTRSGSAGFPVVWVFGGS